MSTSNTEKEPDSDGHQAEQGTAAPLTFDTFFDRMEEQNVTIQLSPAQVARIHGRLSPSTAQYAAGMREAGRLVRLWLQDDDIQRNMQVNRDAARKLAVWPEWLEDMAKFSPEPDASAEASTVDNLAAVVRQLAYALQKASPGHELPGRATAYLKRKNLLGSALRHGESPQE